MNETNNPTIWSKLIKRFSRVTSSGSYMPEIDGLRFVAIMAVLLYHAHILFFAKPIPSSISNPPSWEWLNFAIGQGWFGVQVFFVISGFVLALPFAGHYLENKRAVNLKTYYSRRVVRIGFPYFIALTLGLFYAISGGMHWLEATKHYSAGMLYSHGLIYNGALNPILFVSWTLEIEIQFYLLAPILCKLFSLKTPWVRRIIFLVALFSIQKIYALVNNTWPSPYWSHSILGQLQFFLSGLLLGDLYLTIWKNSSPSPLVARAADIIGTATWLFIPFALKIPSLHKWLAIILLIAFTCVLRGRWLKALLSRPLIATIGGMCYSIYLFHGAILYYLFYNLITPIFGGTKGDWPFNLLPLSILLLLTLAGCAVIYNFVERPSMLWGRKKK